MLNPYLVAYSKLLHILEVYHTWFRRTSMALVSYKEKELWMHVTIGALITEDIETPSGFGKDSPSQKGVSAKIGGQVPSTTAGAPAEPPGRGVRS